MTGGTVIDITQSKRQKQNLKEAKAMGHKKTSFDALVAKLMTRNKKLTRESAQKIAGRIFQDQKKRFGFKKIRRGGRTVTEIAR